LRIDSETRQLKEKGVFSAKLKFQKDRENKQKFMKVVFLLIKDYKDRLNYDLCSLNVILKNS